MIKGYIKSQWAIFGIVICGIICLCSTQLFKVDGQTEYYKIIMFIVIAMLLIGLDFRKYCKKVHQYRYMFESLNNEMEEAAKKMSDSYEDQMAYYSMWVHQIKIPISSLRFMLQAEKNVKKKHFYYAELFRIEQYVDMVLQYLRFQNEFEKVVLKKTEVYQLVKDCVKKFSPLFEGKHIKVEMPFFDHLVMTDENWLMFMVEQILSNAIKYSASGTIHIHSKQEAHRWLLVIRDEGIGIQREDIPRLFDKGYTGHNGRIYKKSKGIGLYLTNSAAQRLGIQIEVRSKVGVGTTVSLVFPENLSEDL